MSRMLYIRTLVAWAFAAGCIVALAGCADTTPNRAPIVDHSVSAHGGGNAGTSAVPLRATEAEPVAGQPGGSQPDEADWRPQTYKVQQGDTLYGIAFNFGLDYHELAQLNNIPNPAYIQAGQVIRLFPAAGAAVAQGSKPGSSDIKTQPLAVTLPYSDQAVAQIEGMQKAQPAQPASGAVDTRPKNDTGSGVVVKAGVAEGNVPVKWEMPASGKVVTGFSEADNRKGIDIAGKLGQPIYASAPGKVIFCGSGLRGYGKLIIIKHNEVYLTAYAHNDKLLVKEGQMVSRGQMIAQMGSTDADRVALHFEIRKLGKPVDPAKYLVFPKS